MILLKGSLEIIGLPNNTGINHNKIGKIPAIIKIDMTNFLSFLKSNKCAKRAKAIKPVKILKKYFILSIKKYASEIMKILTTFKTRKNNQRILRK